MKKIVSLLLILVISTLCLASCSNVTKYELIDIEFANISVSSYEYNYIEFNENNNTYKLENKAKQNGIVTKQTGTYSVDDKGNVSLTNDDNPNMDYVLYNNEKTYFKGNAFYVEAYIPGYGNVSMTFSK